MTYEHKRIQAGRMLQRAQAARTSALNRLRNLAADIARTEVLIRKWDRRVNHYFKRQQMTDEQLAAEVTKRKPKNRRRAITV